MVDDCLIGGFFYSPDGELKRSEDDWDWLRTLLR